MDPEGEARVPRGSALAGERAIDSAFSQGKVPIARTRGEEDGSVFGDDESEEPEEVEVDHLGQLTSLGWYRAETSFPAAEGSRNPGGEDPVARRLRREVAIFKGKNWWSDAVGNPGPLAFTAEDLREALLAGADGDDHDAPGQVAPGSMNERLRRAISWLQAAERRFWDPGLGDWYAWLGRYPGDPEKLCKGAYLHAELWINENTRDEIWVLVGLREGWRVPDGALREAVWGRVVSGRSPFAEPELLPDTAALPPEDASGPGA